MATATYVVECDFDNNGVFTGTGEDITTRTLSAEWWRGRDLASQLDGRSRGGRCIIDLNNESGDYSSFNTSSPLTGLLLPGRKVRIRSTAPSAATLWTGFLSSIRPLPGIHVNKARLEAVGPLAYLNQKSVSLLMKTTTLSGTLIGDILDDAGWPAGDRTIDAGQYTLDRFWVDRLLTLNALREVEDTEGGFILESKGGNIVFEDRHHRYVSPHTTSQATFTDAAGGARVYSQMEQEDPLRFIYNDLRATIRRYTVGSLATLWTMPESGANSPSIEPGQSKDFWASYPNADSATDAVSVNAWTTPVATTDYTANAAADGSGTNLTANITVAVSKFGQAMKITLTNDAAVRAYMTLLQARGTPITVSDPVTVSSEDSASQTAYGERTYPNPAKWLSNTADGLDWANYNKGIYKDPLPFLLMTVHGHRDSTHLTEVLTRDISERITVVATNSAGLGINRAFFIEAEHHRIDSNRHHTVEWLLSDAERYSAAWVLGVSTLGVGTYLVW